MRPLVQRKKRGYNDFRLIDLVYVPDSWHDWVILLLMVVILGLGLYAIWRAEYNFQSAVLKNISQVKNYEDIALSHLGEASFTDYLTGHWVDSDTGKVWTFTFSSPTEGQLITPDGQLFKLDITSTIPPEGSLSFTIDGQPGTGHIYKVWNRDAIVLQMPEGKVRTLVFSLASVPSIRYSFN